jgi:hypothetical protein
MQHLVQDDSSRTSTPRCRHIAFIKAQPYGLSSNKIIILVVLTRQHTGRDIFPYCHMDTSVKAEHVVVLQSF